MGVYVSTDPSATGLYGAQRALNVGHRQTTVIERSNCGGATGHRDHEGICMSRVRWLYTALLFLLIPFILLRLVWRGRRQPGYLRHVAERFGHYREAPPDGVLIWLHAVSVGETRAAEPLVKALRIAYPDHRILLTHMTPTGRETSEQLFGEQRPALLSPLRPPLCCCRISCGTFGQRLGALAGNGAVAESHSCLPSRETFRCSGKCTFVGAFDARLRPCGLA